MADELISTDVDEIIRLLRAKRSIEFSEAARELHVDLADFIKWAHVLEAEGYAYIDHRMMRRYLTWTGDHLLQRTELITTPIEITKFKEAGQHDEIDAAISREQELRDSRLRQEDAKHKAKVELEEYEHAKPKHKETRKEKEAREAAGREAEKEARRKAQEKTREAPAPRQVETAKELREQLEAEREEEEKEEEEIDADERPPTPFSELEDRTDGLFLIKTIAEEDAEPYKSDGEEEVHREPFKIDLFSIFSRRKEPQTLEQEIKAAEDEMAKRDAQQAIEEAAARKQEQAVLEEKGHEAEPALTMPGKPRAFGTLSQKLVHRLAAINEKTEEIQKLKAQKEKLLRETYSPLEKKLEAELETISERILGKEKDILALEARLSTIPEKIGEVEEAHYKMSDVESEARKVFDDVNAHLEEALAELSSLREGSKSTLDSAEKRVYTDYKKLEEMNRLLSKMGSLESDAVQAVSAAQARLTEIQRRVAEASTQLESISDMRSQVEEDVAEISSAVEKQENALAEMNREMSRIGEIERWVEGYREAYGEKLNDFSDFVKQNEQDYSSLRQAVERNFVRKYMKELRSLSEGYDYELDAAAEKERSIDERIAQAKSQINALIEEGKELADVFERGTPDQKHVVSAEELGSRGSNLYAEIDGLRREREQGSTAMERVRGFRYEAGEQKREKEAPSRPERSAADRSERRIKPAKHFKKGRK